MNSARTAVRSILASALMTFGAMNTAWAYEGGDWLTRFGGSYIDPTSDNHETVEVDGAMGFTFNITYMMAPHWGVELLAALPYKHDISLIDGEKVASTKHLPPTLSFQYHFIPSANVQPYVGVGVNYTTFFSEDTKGALAGTDLSLDSSWGWGFDFGVDIMLSQSWFLNLDVRYIGIETDASINGDSIGKVKINPMVYGAHLGFRF
jgi:outer membrane protein